MKVSIITACLNSEETIEDCIKSIDCQIYKDIEHIIIDGGSKDNTLEIISNHRGSNRVVYSNEDKGIYDALNKGLDKASGEIIGILHSDDFYSDSKVISDIVDKFKNLETLAVYADLDYVERDNPSKIKRSWKSGNYEDGIMKQGWMPPHPTLFLKKEVYKEFGTFRLDFSHAADYEFMLRIIEKHKILPTYIQRTIVKMRLGGVSNRTLKDRLIANHEDKRAWEINELQVPSLIQFKKPLRKLRQFL